MQRTTEILSHIDGIWAETENQHKCRSLNSHTLEEMALQLLRWSDTRTVLRFTKIRQVTPFIQLTLMHMLMVDGVNGVWDVHTEYAPVEWVTLHLWWLWTIYWHWWRIGCNKWKAYSTMTSLFTCKQHWNADAYILYKFPEYVTQMACNKPQCVTRHNKQVQKCTHSINMVAHFPLFIYLKNWDTEIKMSKGHKMHVSVFSRTFDPQTLLTISQVCFPLSYLNISCCTEGKYNLTCGI